MPYVRVRIGVSGFTASEVAKGLPDLLDELGHRSYLLKPKACWDETAHRLVVTATTEGGDPRIEGGHGGLIYDNIWDSVIACMNFSSDGIRFEVEEAEAIAEI